MFAVMKETQYMEKQMFKDNFWAGFKEVLGKNHVIKSLDKCDFTPIYEWYFAQREKVKEMKKEWSKEVLSSRTSVIQKVPFKRI